MNYIQHILHYAGIICFPFTIKVDMFFSNKWNGRWQGFCNTEISLRNRGLTFACISWQGSSCVCVLFFSICLSSGKVQSCNSSLSERTYHKACHTSVRIPLTSLVPADFLLWCSQRAAETHICIHSHTHTHTPMRARTHNHEQTYIHTLSRLGHHAALGLDHRTLDRSICVTRFVIFYTKTELRMFANVSLLLWFSS